MSDSNSFLQSVLEALAGLLNSLRQLLSPSTPPAPQPAPGPVPSPDNNSTDPPLQVLTPRALVVVFDPILDASTGQRLSQAPETATWKSVDDLIAGYIADIDQCSGGLVKYRVVERVTRDYFPVKEDQFTYDAASYLQAVRTRQYHDPDLANYDVIVNDLQLLQRVASGGFDEVWLFGGPGFGFYESRMAGPGAFWCNAPPYPNSVASHRRFVIMGFSYERGVGEMLEDMGHRAESVMDYRWRNVAGDLNLWKKYARYEAVAPGQAEVGMMHWAPNSVRDYDWGNPAPVVTAADNWLSFPDLSSQPKTMICSAWGNGDIRAHHKWWFERLPKIPGRTSGVANNWWRYVVNVADPGLDGG